MGAMLVVVILINNNNTEFLPVLFWLWLNEHYSLFVIIGENLVTIEFRYLFSMSLFLFWNVPVLSLIYK